MNFAILLPPGDPAILTAFALGPAPGWSGGAGADHLTTEAGDRLTTQAGDQLVTD
jgi:hypothetical protein